jgi:hypothetical protein
MRRSSVFLSITAVMTALLALCFLHAARAGVAAGPAVERRAATVRALALTDLCLFTEAPYTRHLSQAGLHAPFQEHPLALEHYPSGSLAGPPEHLRR